MQMDGRTDRYYLYIVVICRNFVWICPNHLLL